MPINVTQYWLLLYYFPNLKPSFDISPQLRPMLPSFDTSCPALKCTDVNCLSAWKMVFREKHFFMKIPKLSTNYGKLSDANLSLKAIDIKNSLTDNPNFTPAPPSFANFITVMDDYETALGQVTSRDRVKIALKNQSRLLLLHPTDRPQSRTGQLIALFQIASIELQIGQLLGQISFLGLLLAEPLRPGLRPYGLKAQSRKQKAQQHSSRPNFPMQSSNTEPHINRSHKAPLIWPPPRPRPHAVPTTDYSPY